MRKIFRTILIFLMVCLFGFSGTVQAAPSGITPRLVFNKNIFLPGDRVTMSLQLTGTKTTDKTNSVSFDIEYDGNAFALETGSAEKDITDGYIKFATKFDTDYGSTKKISLMYVSMATDTCLQEGKDLFTVSFKVKQNALEGAKLFKLLPVKMLDMNFNAYKVNGDQIYCNSVEVGSTSHVKVVINGQTVNFDVPPQIQNGRTFVPFRKIFEALGASVAWEPSTKVVTGARKDTKVVLQIDSTNAIVNNINKKLDVAPTIVDGRTLVPARFISESLGAVVDWDGDTRTVTIVLQ